MFYLFCFRHYFKRFIPRLFHDNLKTTLCFNCLRWSLNKGFKLKKYCVYLLFGQIPSDEYLLNLNMCLACAAIIPVRLDQFFQNGALKPFFKLLFGELDALQKALQGCWVSSKFNNYVILLKTSQTLSTFTIASSCTEPSIRESWFFARRRLISWMRRRRRWPEQKTIMVGYN